MAYDSKDEIFWYCEYADMPIDLGYMSKLEEKLSYNNNANEIYEGKNLIISSDGDNGSLDSKEIDNLIKRTIGIG